MVVTTQQTSINEVISDLSDKLNLFLRDKFASEIQEKTGLSQPTISALKRNKAETMSLNTLFQIAKAIGYEVQIKLLKIEDEQDN